MTVTAPPTRLTLVGTGLLAACLVLIPVNLALQFATLSYVPGGQSTCPPTNLHTWAWICTALLAVGMLLVRPLEGKEKAFRARCLPLVALAMVMLVDWLTAVVALATTGGANPRALTPALLIGLLVHFICLFLAPVLVWLLARAARRWELLAFAQFVPWVWILMGIGSGLFMA